MAAACRKHSTIDAQTLANEAALAFAMKRNGNKEIIFMFVLLFRDRCHPLIASGMKSASIISYRRMLWLPHAFDESVLS